jgi:hypothetical protein
MNRKLSKASIIILFCLLFLPGFIASSQTVLKVETPQQNQLKIISVTKGVSLSGDLYVKGKSLPNKIILLTVKDASDVFSYSVKTNSDSKGNWSADFNQLLKEGRYYIQAIQEDSSGVQTGSVIFGPVEIKGSFYFIILVFSLLVVILLVGFVGGWYINKLAEVKRYRRILMSQRDIVASYNVLKNDVDKAMKNLTDNKTEQWKVSETDFLLKRINDNLEKMNKYVVQGVNTIGKYDIISKISK